jgi:hypothetical protein
LVPAISGSARNLRLIAGTVGNHRDKRRAGEKDTDEGAIDVTEGGTTIPYWLGIRSAAGIRSTRPEA